MGFSSKIGWIHGNLRQLRLTGSSNLEEYKNLTLPNVTKLTGNSQIISTFQNQKVSHLTVLGQICPSSIGELRAFPHLINLELGCLAFEGQDLAEYDLNSCRHLQKL